jgi:hypothetical protein
LIIDKNNNNNKKFDKKGAKIHESGGRIMI